MTGLSDGSTFAYDANGNMTTRTQDGVTWTYTFDAENRLTQVVGNGVTTTMVYDGIGACIKRIVYCGAGGAFRILGGENEHQQSGYNGGRWEGSRVE